MAANSSAERMPFFCKSARRSILAKISVSWAVATWVGAGAGALLGTAVHRNDGQSRHAHGAVLAGKDERASASLLLREATDLVVERIVDGHMSIQLHSQPVRPIEVGVADVILRAAAVRRSKFRGPPLP